MTPTGGTATTLTAAGTTNTELVTQGSMTLRNGLPGVQALTTGGNTSYVQRDPKGGLLALITGSGTTGEYYYVLDGQAASSASSTPPAPNAPATPTTPTAPTTPPPPWAVDTCLNGGVRCGTIGQDIDPALP